MNLGIIFGSRSAEHDVSIITGLQVLENADRESITPFPYTSHVRAAGLLGSRLGI